jgi:hypothetical protein
VRKIIYVVVFALGALLIAKAAQADVPPGCYVSGSCHGAGSCADDGLACTSDMCSGSGQCLHCPTVGNVCRPAAGTCDVAEYCAAGSLTCPGDQLAAAGEVCRASAGVCDVAESCSGSSASCPTDGFLRGTVCRAKTDQCDAAELCDGSVALCPDDAAKADGSRCDDGRDCSTTDSCQAGSCEGQDTATCPVCSVDADCDDHDVCTGAERCVAGACQNSRPPTCDDGNPCTSDMCDPTAGCASVPTTGNACDDELFCTIGDTCNAGVCESGTTQRTCSGAAGSCTARVCSEGLRACVAANSDFGATCDDGNPCTSGDRCGGGGVCTGSADLVCWGAVVPHDISNPAGACGNGAALSSGGTCMAAATMVAGTIDGRLAAPAELPVPADVGEVSANPTRCNAGTPSGGSSGSALSLLLALTLGIIIIRPRPDLRPEA